MAQLNVELIEKWKSQSNIENNLNSLQSINTAFAQKSKFDEVNFEVAKGIRDVFVSQLPDASVSYKKALLELIKCLSRDKNVVTPLFSEELAETLLRAGGIFPESTSDNYEVVVEAEKVLNNAFHNSVVARTVFEKKCDSVLIKRIAAVIKNLQNPDNSFESDFQYLSDAPQSTLETLLFFDLKIAFITSAHSLELQNKWVADDEKVNTFLEVVKFSCQNLPITDNQKSEWAQQALMVLYSMYVYAQVYDIGIAEEVAKECASLVKNPRIEDDMKTTAVHFLVTMGTLLPSLCPEVNENEQIESTKTFENYDMRFVHSLLELFSRKFDATPLEETDMLSPFLVVLLKLCENHKAARRYCRLMIIPPLKAEHVQMPPDEGKTLRNKLVRMLTTTGQCKILAEGFLFVLCKRSVPRLIKYTGFGHSAGFLANSGLLAEINNRKRDSDSEDSETESYNEVRDRVHPVTGYIQPDLPNPLDNMTEEQKEFEAMKLANAMDKLMSEGIFQPGKIGPDGKPVPVSHVNELLKHVPSDEEERESDNDE